MLVNNIKNEVSNGITNAVINIGKDFITGKYTSSMIIHYYDPKFSVFMDWLNKIDSGYVKNHMIKPANAGYGIMATNYDLKPGNYYIKLKNLVIHMTRVCSNTRENNEDTLTIQIIGTKHKEFSEKLKSYMEDKANCSGIKVLSCTSYDGLRTKYMPRKPWESIVTDKKDDIITFIDNWSRSESLYKSKSQIYKTGVLLYGEPGTGKTSIAQAIATQLEYNLMSVKLSDISNLNIVQNQINNIPPNTVVLFDDIDCVLGDTDRKDNEKEVPAYIKKDKQTVLTMVLSLLDGTDSVGNCVYVATTNHIERLDDALIRAGRFDLRVELNNFTESEAKQMCALNNIEESILENYEYPINPARLNADINQLLISKLKKVGK